VRHRIPIGTQIVPYAQQDGSSGEARLTTVDVVFERQDILDRIVETDPGTHTEAKYLCLPLDDNPSGFDSYLVRASDVIAVPE
jgi:hypothetical protein